MQEPWHLFSCAVPGIVHGERGGGETLCIRGAGFACRGRNVLARILFLQPFTVTTKLQEWLFAGVSFPFPFPFPAVIDAFKHSPPCVSLSTLALTDALVTRR